MKKVTIYSTPTCHFCKMTKELFAENNIEYTEYNVAEDEARRDEMVEISGHFGTPVIVFEEDGKRDVVVGYNEPKIKEMLGL